MPRTSDQGFAEFLSRLTASDVETMSVVRHRQSIERCLKADFGNAARLFRCGSYGNGTSISGFSDIDYFAVLPRSSLTETSTASLGKIRHALDTRLLASGLSVRCPAVRIPFDGTPANAINLVPAFDTGKKSGAHAIFGMPDCRSGKWRATAPTSHLEYVSAADERLSKRVKPLIQLVKAWKYYNAVPLSSLYLEMRVAKWSRNETVLSYPFDVYLFLKHLQDIDLAQLQDPTGIGAYIPPNSSPAEERTALSKLKTAVAQAARASTAHNQGNTYEAFEWWIRLFDGKFPGYYA